VCPARVMTDSSTNLAAGRGDEPATRRTSGAKTSVVPGESRSAQALRERLLAVTEEARRLSRVLPQAMAMSVQGGGMADAMAPAVERALALEGHRAPAALGDALHPAIGRALRSACRATLRRGLLRINRVLLKYGSVTGLRWRMEALRARKPFAQVFLEHTRQHPVKQVFLIHRETGILLQQVQSEVDPTQDWDVVSGMLTAIGDFIHDSFSIGKDEQLETIRVGELTILIEQGKHAALAGMLRGEVPADLRARMRAAQDRIHAQFAHELELFDGETSVFDKSRGELESCLQTLVSTDQTRILPQTWLVLVLPLLALAVWGGFSVRAYLNWRNYLEAIGRDAGVVIIAEGRRDGRYFIHGLREAAALDPVKVLAQHGFVVNDVESRWAPFQWDGGLPDPGAVARPAEPAGVPLLERVRRASGHAWLRPSGVARQRAREAASPGGSAIVDLEDVTISDLGEYRRWEKFIEQLSQEPGLVVLESGRRDGRFHVRGLRDPLARDPATLISQFGLAPGDVSARWEPYQALEPAFTLERARQALDPPRDVTLELRDGVLLMAGRAPRRWIERAESVARAIPGVRTVSRQQLLDLDLDEIVTIQSQIEGEVFRFLFGAPDLWPGQGARIEALSANVERLQRAVERHGGYTCAVEICGHTTASGNTQRDLADSLELANSFYENLKNSGADVSRYTRRGLGSVPPPNLDDLAREANNRLVSFASS
jgi:hypothetical protein